MLPFKKHFKGNEQTYIEPVLQELAVAAAAAAAAAAAGTRQLLDRRVPPEYGGSQ